MSPYSLADSGDASGSEKEPRQPFDEGGFMVAMESEDWIGSKSTQRFEDSYAVISVTCMRGPAWEDADPEFRATKDIGTLPSWSKDAFRRAGRSGMEAREGGKAGSCGWKGVGAVPTSTASPS